MCSQWFWKASHRLSQVILEEFNDRRWEIQLVCATKNLLFREWVWCHPLCEISNNFGRWCNLKAPRPLGVLTAAWIALSHLDYVATLRRIVSSCKYSFRWLKKKKLTSALASIYFCLMTAREFKIKKIGSIRYTPVHCVPRPSCEAWNYWKSD